MLPKRNLLFIKTDPETPKTQLVIVTGLLAIAAITNDEALAYLSLLIGILCLATPKVGDMIVWGWYKLAEVLSKVTTPLILSFVYYLFITPIALLFRLFGNAPLDLEAPKGSMYEIREKIFSKKDLERPW